MKDRIPMNAGNLMKAIGDIDDRYILEAEPGKAGRTAAEDREIPELSETSPVSEHKEPSGQSEGPGVIEASEIRENRIVKFRAGIRRYAGLAAACLVLLAAVSVWNIQKNDRMKSDGNGAVYEKQETEAEEAKDAAAYEEDAKENGQAAPTAQEADENKAAYIAEDSAEQPAGQSADQSFAEDMVVQPAEDSHAAEMMELEEEEVYGEKELLTECATEYMKEAVKEESEDPYELLPEADDLAEAEHIAGFSMDLSKTDLLNDSSGFTAVFRAEKGTLHIAFYDQTVKVAAVTKTSGSELTPSSAAVDQEKKQIDGYQYLYEIYQEDTELSEQLVKVR